MGGEAIREIRMGTTFAAGHCYTSMFGTVVLSKLQSMPWIMFLLKPLVYGRKKVDKKGNLRISHVLLLVPVPECCVNKEYRELVAYMLGEPEHDIPIGLYRAPHSQRMTTKAYVFTNPPPSTIVHRDDKVYVLVNSDVAKSGHRRPINSSIASESAELAPVLSSPDLAWKEKSLA